MQRDELAADMVIRKYVLTRPERWDEFILSRRRHRWFMDAVGYLMLAVMPRREEQDTTERLCISENCWSPGSAAARLARSRNEEPWVIDVIGNRRYETFTTTILKRHNPVADGTGIGTRTALLDRLKAEVKQREMDSDVPPDIMQAFWATFNQAEADAKVTGEYEWLPNFNLEIRGWRSKANQGHSGTAPAAPVPDYNGPAPQQYAEDNSGVSGDGGSGDDGGGGDDDDDDDAVWSSGSENQPPGSAKSARRAIPDRPWQATYYTVGEVGNHRFRRDLWALVDDGSSGFDVYDVTGMVL